MEKTSLTYNDNLVIKYSKTKPRPRQLLIVDMNAKPFPYEI